VKLTNIKPNPQNPRLIKDERFKKLVQSIKDFPEMMAKRPMVCVTDVDGKLFPLGGNMRLKALKEAGYTDIPDEWVTMADEWTQEQRNEFIIKDNISFGEHDWEALKDWDTEQLEDWGLEVPEFATEEENEDFETEKTSTLNLEYLKFSNYSIPISQDEINGLSELVNDYIEENSIPNGFVLKIIQCLKK